MYVALVAYATVVGDNTQQRPGLRGTPAMAGGTPARAGKSWTEEPEISKLGKLESSNRIQ